MKNSSAMAAVQATDIRQPSTSISMQNTTYNLNPEAGDDFYGTLSEFTDDILFHSEYLYPKHIDAFIQYQSEARKEIRHRNEYLVEFLMLGMLSGRYWPHANKSSELSISLHSWLYGMRKRRPSLKPTIDNIRGYSSARWMYAQDANAGTMARHGLPKLIRWLNASGEFKEEAQRLTSWSDWLSQLPEGKASAHLAASQEYSEQFAKSAEETFRKFTGGIAAFLNSHHENYLRREDYLFCGRSTAEYHLNMFGAEILNRVMRSDFDQTSERILIVPSCMSEPRTECRAVSAGLHKICTGCTSKCGVSNLQRSMQLQGIAVRIIPHSSGFSKFLEPWQHQKQTGLIGVACVLNLLAGGYEMQRLGIPSQCVFLDNSGCKKHWHPQGVPTKINELQLIKIACGRKCSVAC